MVDAALSDSPAETGRRGTAPVLMIVHSYYEEDPRVRREAEALVAAGHPVTVIGLRREGDPPQGDIAGVELELLNVQRHQGAGVLVYLREYLSFLVRSAWVAARLHRRRHFRLAQVHSLPDFLVFAAMPLRLTGVPLILDLHEAMPEFFKTRFPGAANPVTYRLLLLSERLSIAVATRVLTVNDAMCSRLLRLGVRPDKLTVVINSPSLGRFDATAHPTRAFREDGRLRLVYTGALTPTYELDVALRALAAIAVRRPDLDVRLDLYGRGDSEDALRTLAAELGLGERVVFHGRIPIEDVPRAVAEADIGLAPTRLDPFTHMTLSTKVYEYAAMRKTVVASRLPLIQESFPPDTVMAYEPGNEDEMTGAILALADDAAERVARIERTLEIVRETSWEVASRPYLALVEQLSRSV